MLLEKAQLGSGIGSSSAGGNNSSSGIPKKGENWDPRKEDNGICSADSKVWPRRLGKISFQLVPLQKKENGKNPFWK